MMETQERDLTRNLRGDFETVRSQYRNEIPVPLPLIARDLDIELRYEEQLDSTDGFLAYYGKGKFVIVLDKDLPETRQRFTFAHELAHFALHSNLADLEQRFKEKKEEVWVEGFIGMRRNEADYNEVEKEANNFAANLLMPKHLMQDEFEKAQKKCGKITLFIINYLADRFDVSFSAMKKRLEYLKLI